MGMTIDNARHLIEHHKPKDVNNAYELGEAFCVAINTMRKYQKIEEIYREWFSDTGHTSADAYERIGEVIKDGNVD